MVIKRFPSITVCVLKTMVGPRSSIFEVYLGTLDSNLTKISTHVAYLFKKET